jgi:hypothetical protein
MITKENIAILLGFILGTLIAAGIIFFIVIGFSMMFGVIPTHKPIEPIGSEPVGPGGGLGELKEYECFVNGAYYPSSSGKCIINTDGWDATDYNYTVVPNRGNYTGEVRYGNGTYS